MVVKIENQLELKVISSTLLPASDLNLVLTLCNRSYEEDLEPFFNTLQPATHVLGYYKQTLVTHSMWVDRLLYYLPAEFLFFGDGRPNNNHLWLPHYYLAN